MAAPQIVSGGPPAPTEEQIALTDSSAKPVELAFDKDGKLVSPDHNVDLVNRIASAVAALPAHFPFPPPPSAVPPQRAIAIDQVKEKGNAAFKANKLPEAVQFYTLAIDLAADRPPWEPAELAAEELANVLSNRSAALLAAGDFVAALADADAAVKLRRS